MSEDRKFPVTGDTMPAVQPAQPIKPVLPEKEKSAPDTKNLKMNNEIEKIDLGRSVSYYFNNEHNKRIQIEVVLGIELCKFTINGPDSSLEGYVTKIELEKLNRAITEVLS
jgi:hypothetical protein